MPTKLTHENAALKICVDVADSVVRGRIYGLRLRQPLEFRDMGSLLLQVERLMDSQNFPQAFQRIRSFQKKGPEYPPSILPEDGMTQAQVDEAQGGLSTFLLQVVSRQNATWQGRVTWPGEEPVEFSSDLELLDLVESRLLAP